MKKPILILLAFAMVLVAFTESTFKKDFASKKIKMELLQNTLIGDKDFQLLVNNGRAEMEEMIKVFETTNAGKKNLTKKEKANVAKAFAENTILAKARETRIALLNKLPDLKELSKEDFITVFKKASKKNKANLMNIRMKSVNDTLQCIADCESTYMYDLNELEMHLVGEQAYIEAQYSTCVGLCPGVPVGSAPDLRTPCLNNCGVTAWDSTYALGAFITERSRFFLTKWQTCDDVCLGTP